MSIKVVIEREFKETPTLDDLRTIDEIRVKALRDRGYIGGETIINVENSREVIVLSAWASVDDWKLWYDKKDWEELERKLVPRLEQTAKIRIFMPGAEYKRK